MERILRSCLQVGGVPEPDDALANWNRLQEHDLEFPADEDRKIQEYLRSFYGQMSAPPDFVLVKEYFEKKDEIEVVARLDEIKKSQFYIRTNFLSIVRAEREQQSVKNFVLACRDAQQIAEYGRNVDKPVDGKKILRGPQDAIGFLFDKMSNLTSIEAGEKLEGDITQDAEDVLKEYEQVAGTSKYANRNLFGLEPVDVACRGHKAGEYWIHTAFTGELKCVSASSTIYDHKTKRRRSIGEVFQSGDLPIVTALAQEGKNEGGKKLVQARVSHVVENGIQPVFELSLWSGRKTRATGNHPFFTSKGWKRLDEIQSGDFVAIPRQTQVQDTRNDCLDAELSLIGCLLGEGDKYSGVWLHNENIEVCEHWMGIFHQIPHMGNSRKLFNEIGLSDDSLQEKFIPDGFFSFSEHQIEILLSSMWTTNQLKGKWEDNQIVYESGSERLCLSIQSLLLRLGIQSLVGPQYLEHGNQWFVAIVGSQSKHEFIRRIRVLGRGDWLERISKSIPSDDESTHSIQDGDLIFDEVVRVLPRGEEMTYDVSVPEHKSFLVDDIVSHNTTVALNYLYNNTYKFEKNIFYAILEMPYSQLRRQLYVLHSSHGKFVTEWYAEDKRRGLPEQERYTGLDYRKVRDGELDDIGKSRLVKVAQDYKTTRRGVPYIWRPELGNPTIKDIKRKAEMFHNKYGCDGIVIDHLGLVKPQFRTNDHVTSINTVIQEGRMLALNFARGKTVPVLGLFQLNRQGKLRADKADGHYDIAAISYANECISEDTLVKTQTGFKAIKDVIPGTDKVWSSSGWKGVLDRFDNGIRPTFKVRVHNGVEIQATASHRIRTLCDGVIGWTEVKDLKPGMQCLSDFGIYPFASEPPELPPLEFFKYERAIDNNGVELRVPTHLTNDLTYLMGAFVGDGYYCKNARKIGYVGNIKEQVLMNKLMGIFKDVFGQKLSYSNSTSRKPVFDLYKCSRPLTRWFESVGMDRRYEIPSLILNAPRSMVESFLQGIMDTDGWINNQGIVGFGLKGAHEKTMRQIQLLFSSLGINTTLKYRLGRLNGSVFPQWFLMVKTCASRRLFAEIIGFTEPHKQLMLSKFAEKPNLFGKAEDFTKWSLGSLLREIVADYSAGHRFTRKAIHSLGLGSDLVSVGCILSILDELKDVEDERLGMIRRLISSCVPVTVVSIIPAQETRVYDLEVTGDHEYSTGGLLSHNCEKSADCITYTYLNDELRRQGKFYLGCLKNRDNPIFERMVGKILWQSKRMRAIESNLLDMTNDQLKKTATALSMEDLLEVG